MRNSFFSRKNDSTATTCAAGFACSDANTNNNSVLLLTMTLCLQCRFLLYSAFWALRRQQDTPNRYSRDNTTALGIPRVGPDRFGRGRFFVV